MSLVDKFVLVPFEQYDQLMRDNEDVKKFDDKEKDIEELELETTREKKPEKEIEGQKKTKQEENINKVEEPKKEEEEYIRKPKLSPINKVPARPPGIPERSKKRIRWESLF